MRKSEELREQRAKLVADARVISDAAEKEKRDLHVDEVEKYEKISADIDKLMESAERLEHQEKLELEMSTRISPQAGGGASGGPAAEQTFEEKTKEAFARYMRTGVVSDEFRALQSGSDVEGGFLTAPEAFVNQLLKKVDDDLHLRQLATVTQIGTAESLGVPTLDTDVADADWTTELATGNEDTNIRFGKRELRPHPLAKRVKISQKLIRQARFDIESFVISRFAYKFGVTQEKAFMTGDGFQKPLGLFTVSSDGLSTAVDKLSGAATTFVADNLIDIKYSLKPQYWRQANWLFHRDAIAKIRKLKTVADGQYVWQPGLQAGQPDRLLELPLVVSEFVPNTFTSGKYVGMVGDFSFYWIVDSLALGFQRLAELYAETNQVGYISRLELDGMPTFEEPFIRIKTS